MNIKKTHNLFSGELRFYEHSSLSTKTQMNFSVFLPQDISKIDSAIIFLSGLTCTEENFMAKSGIGSVLSGSNTMIICPDTSPRGLDLEGEHDSYDFGSGAGFYVNATTPDYSENYNMHDYINTEIHTILGDEFNINSDKISIMGHSMGGHGALISGLKNPDKYQSISAFAPIVNPIASAWGQKAFAGYLGNDQQSWKQYDACELIKSGSRHSNTIFIDQGTDDEFLSEQLLAQNFVGVCEKYDQKLEFNMREGYDHSYYFISSFLENHIKFHKNYLK
ncbi:S-formylglutathione hydrolase [Candidatus Gracilibacteria bacterium]|nr:S-formylglutathione hydrolase [Candidatus Gracilibacteria bacterium]